MTPGALLYSVSDRPEARRVAFGALRDFRVVAVGLFQQARREAARARHDVVGVRLAFVDEAHAVLLALTASSNAACTFSGGCTLCSVTFWMLTPVL